MLSKNRIKFLKSLQIKKIRQEQALFIVEGEKILTEVLQSSYPVEELYCTESFLQKYPHLIKSIDYQLVKSEELVQAGTLQSNESGLMMLKMLPNHPIYPQKNEFALVLDGVQDPGNFGTIIRIADWYGLHKIICSEDTVEFYNPKVIAASMASFLRVEVFYTQLVSYLNSHQNIPIYGAVLAGENLHQTKFAQAGFIVLGNESKGIRAELMPLISHKITIPRFGQAESLNVGIAGAVILDNLRRNKIDS
jgi:TrmH family RNA methyltransferase